MSENKIKLDPPPLFFFPFRGVPGLRDTNLAYLAGYAFSTGGAFANPFLRAFMRQLKSNLDIIVSFSPETVDARGDPAKDFSTICFCLCFLSFAFLRFFSSPILLRAFSRSLAAFSSVGVVEIGSSPR